jgi:hypothetical protein
MPDETEFAISEMQNYHINEFSYVTTKFSYGESGEMQRSQDSA